ncbi:MAG: hypothetical protein M3357_08790, partial [Actinomycetota bacterium]|nr:hypothetical protein [Actinomycetota bacterium]
MSQDPLPTGFQLGLMDDWEIVDLAEPTVLRIGLSDAPFTLANAHWRLGDIEHATEGLQIRARLKRIVDGSPAEAACVLSVYATDVDNDPDSLQAALTKGGDTTDRVALPAGTAVRRTGRRLAAGELPERFVHQFFIPVPGTDNELAFLEFWSPTFAAEGYLRPHFEGVASSFEFTYADSEIVLGNGTASGSDVVPEPAAAGTWLADQSLREHQATVPQLRLGPLIRSAFAGWPRRFTALAHLAVTSWMAAAIVIASRVFADARRGPGAV